MKLIAETSGSWNHSVACYNVNMSEIFTKLLRNLRYLDDYLSDIIIDIDSVNVHLRIHADTVVSVKTFWFGFRESGVDGEGFIESQLKSGPTSYYYYRAFNKLEVIKDGDNVRCRLYSADRYDFCKEHGIHS